jgi:hypothetical protein
MFVGVGLAALAPPLAKDPLSQMEVTPRFYLVTASGGMAAQNGAKMCFGGEALRKLLGVFQDMAKDPTLLNEVSKGCTRDIARSGGFVSIVQDCQKANGAPFTRRMRISGSPDEIRQHFEMTLAGIGPNGSDKEVVGDVKMTLVGQCPSNVKPGQILMPTGEVLDPLAELTRESGDGDHADATAPK